MDILNKNDEIPPNARIVKTYPDRIEVYYTDDEEVMINDAVLADAENSKTRADKKEKRGRQVNLATVTTAAGNLFDADETSQNRMARAIIVMDDTETTLWILADNTPAQVTKAELIEALRLAGESQTNIWEIK